MKFEFHTFKGKTIAELITNDQVINEYQDFLDLIGNASYQEATVIIIYQYQVHPDFFKLSTGFAGEMLQKFSNYRMRLVIVGDFVQYQSNSLHDFIYESNNGSSINFVASKEEAFEKICV